MATATTSGILQQIRRLVEDGRTSERSDQELLAQFARDRDEAAFQALVRRHGSMVLEVCRAVLGNEADAEDAFQATFLVMARKARSLRKPAALASWLHGIAYRVALDSRRKSSTRCRHETRVPSRQGAAPEGPTWREAQLIVHEELAGLSPRQREPLVLCYLQGRTQDEAAQMLGVAKSTLKIRLERGRALLRSRLVRRGLGPAALLLASAWPAAAAPGILPPSLLGMTVTAGLGAAAGQPLPAVAAPTVAALAQAALRMTLYRKLATAVVAAFALTVCGFGGGWLAWPGQAVGNDPAVDQAPAVQEPMTQADSVIDRFVAKLKAQPARRFAGEDDLGLFLLDIGKGNTSLIATEVDHERAYCGSPCWSGDGRRILFDASPGKQWSRTRLQQFEWTDQGVGLSSVGAGNCPTISPDGKHVAYLVNPGAAGNVAAGVWVMQADGAQRRHLGSFGIPKWSPDGRRLLLVSFASPCKLSLLDAATGEERALEIPGHQVYSVPSWVAESSLAAVVRSDKGSSIALVEVTDEGNAKVKETLWERVDRLGVEPIYPVYSPRTKRCIFVGRDKQGQALYGFEPGQRDAPRRLESGALDRKIASLALSPDGRYLLFCSDRPWPR